MGVFSERHLNALFWGLIGLKKGALIRAMKRSPAKAKSLAGVCAKGGVACGLGCIVGATIPVALLRQVQVCRVGGRPKP